jgi:hypothetical protein
VEKTIQEPQVHIMLRFKLLLDFFLIYYIAIAYVGSMREAQSQDTQHLSSETLMGEKTKQKLP